MHVTRPLVVRLGVILGLLVAALVASPVGARQFSEFGGLGKKPGLGATEEKVTVSAVPSQGAVAPGGRFVVAVTLNHAAHWHSWPSADQDVLPESIADFAIRAAITAPDPKPDWIGSIGRIQWPEPTLAPVPDFMRPGKTIEVPVYQGRAVAFVPVTVAPGASEGARTLLLTVEYQACDDTTCEQPMSVEVPVEIDIDPGAAAAGLTGEFAQFDVRNFDASATKPAAPTVAGPGGGSTFFGLSLSGLTGPFGFVVLALLSAVGGLILNLTPCVLPVIPIKVLSLTKSAGTPRKTLILGIWMAAGVVAFWLLLGVLAASVASLVDPSRIFGIWWVTTGLGVLIAAMGVGIMGMFTINLPQQVYMVNPQTDTAGGSFFFGVMTAVLGLPCFGFVAGALLTASTTFGSTATIVIFAALGVGMALPYLVLSAKPQWVERLPRAGPASELVKQVMGLLLLAAAAYFVGAGLKALVQDYPAIGKTLHWWVVALFALAAGGWLVLRTFQITKKALPRGAFGLIGLVVAAGGVLAAWNQTYQARTSTWVDYSESVVAQALASNKVVVMDFTAEWCLNCKALKAAVLNANPVKPELDRPDVVKVTVDLTSTKAPGWEKLRALGQTGIPLLVIQGPGLDEPWMSNAYTSDQVLDAIGRARGSAGAVSQAR